MKLEINLIGSAEAIKSITEAVLATNDHLRDVVLTGALSVERDAKRACPVDNGPLRASITHEMISNNEARVGTNKEYAAFVEYGTVRHLAPVGNWGAKHGFGKARFLWVSGKAQPYLYPALAMNQSRITMQIEDVIKRFGQ